MTALRVTVVRFARKRWRGLEPAVNRKQRVTINILKELNYAHDFQKLTDYKYFKGCVAS